MDESPSAATAFPLQNPSAHIVLHVHVYPSRLFAAHWSFFLPLTESAIGDRAHVTGDRLNGFQYEYLQGYNPRDDDRHPIAFPIGRVPATALLNATDVPGAFNEFDQCCQEVPAPGPSLNKVVRGADEGPVPRRQEVKDCQWWIKRAVGHLVDKGALLALENADTGSESPSERVQRLPKH